MAEELGPARRAAAHGDHRDPRQQQEQADHLRQRQDAGGRAAPGRRTSAPANRQKPAVRLAIVSTTNATPSVAAIAQRGVRPGQHPDQGGERRPRRRRGPTSGVGCWPAAAAPTAWRRQTERTRVREGGGLLEVVLDPAGLLERLALLAGREVVARLLRATDAHDHEAARLDPVLGQQVARGAGGARGCWSPCARPGPPRPPASQRQRVDHLGERRRVDHHEVGELAVPRRAPCSRRAATAPRRARRAARSTGRTRSVSPNGFTETRASAQRSVAQQHLADPDRGPDAERLGHRRPAEVRLDQDHPVAGQGERGRQVDRAWWSCPRRATRPVTRIERPCSNPVPAAGKHAAKRPVRLQGDRRELPGAERLAALAARADPEPAPAARERAGLASRSGIRARIGRL